MPVVSSIFLVIALMLAVVIGPQTRSWTWGPAMIALGFSVLSAFPVFWKREKSFSDFGLLAFGAMAAGWFAWRAWISPVAELGQADLLLVAGVVGAFISVRAITGSQAGERVLIWGIALLLLANVGVIAKQILEPGYTPVFRPREGMNIVSGFLAHYIEAANYLVASSMLVAAAAIFGKHSTPTRVIWLLIAVAGMAGVWFTRGRGGIIGGAVALGVLVVMGLVVGKRRDARWFGPALLFGLPIGVLGALAFLYMGWSDAQETRRISGGIEGTLDNNARLYFLGVALSCVGLHPMAGGGSRSFGWECFRFVDGKAQGDIITHKPDLVHNEFMQAATDYGLVGAGLLLGLIGTLVIVCSVRLVFEDRPSLLDSRDAWRAGGLAALAGLLTQSCFSFVFHLMPGILLLGICMGMVSHPASSNKGLGVRGSRILLAVAAIGCALVLLPAGWRGSQVTRILWPVYFSKNFVPSSESKVTAYDAAIPLWPLSNFHQERGVILQEMAGDVENPQFQSLTELAISDYQEAIRLHPHDPGPVLNLAILLSQTGRNDEAEQWFGTAIQLQGGMEPGFRSHFHTAKHFLRKGLGLYDPENPSASHKALEQSARHIEAAVNKMHWVIGDMVEPRVSIHENLGAAREANGDREGAMESYDFAASLPNGKRAHYRAGLLIGRMAVEVWSKRQSSEALAKFIEARRRIALAGGELPVGVPTSQSVEYVDYLDRMIALLKGANIVPKE